MRTVPPLICPCTEKWPRSSACSVTLEVADGEMRLTCSPRSMDCFFPFASNTAPFVLTETSLMPPATVLPTE
jgi:hypothetical protein